MKKIVLLFIATIALYNTTMAQSFGNVEALGFDGTNGSVNAGYNIGIFPKYNGGISLNNRNKKINIFGNYNYNDSKNKMKFNLYRDVLDTIFDGRTVARMNNETHSFKGGLDYFISNKST